MSIQEKQPPSAVADSVTFSRRELKFVLADADPQDVIALLRGNAEEISFNGCRTSEVNSIYFDNSSLRTCTDSIDGVSPRSKVRLRWYDRPFASDKAFFELKQRDNQHVRKVRHEVAFDRPIDTIEFAEVKAEIVSQLGEVALLPLEKYGSAAVMVCYDRVHFRERGGVIRMTVDYNIRGYDQWGARAPRRWFEAPLDGLVVIEVKIPDGHEARVAPLLYPLKPRLSRSSKYASCASRMGWGLLSDIQD